jgi:DNA repair photolyase
MSPGFYNRQSENPHNARFESIEVEYDEGVERPQAMRVYKEVSKSILTRNDSPDIPFRWSVNPYRGCAHACSYCYARPYHEYLGLSAGTDFDTQIVAKVNAPELLEKELSKPSWRGEAIALSGITDCYQPAEAALKITRRCLEVCLGHQTPVGLITKSLLVTRDLDVLAALSREAGATVCVSIPFWNAEDARGMEPFAPPPEARFRVLEKLAAAGVRTGISVSPLIPGWNDSDIPKVLRRAGEAGVSFAFYTLLRLPGAVEPVFLSRLRRDFPERAGKVEHHMRETHGGNLKHTGFGDRMKGSGKMADVIADLFRLHVRKNGIDRREAGNMRMPPENPARPAAAEPGPRRKPDNPGTPKKTPQTPGFQTDLFG